MSRSMAGNERIEIHGLGIIAPGAIGRAELESMLLDGRSGLDRVERFDTDGLGAHRAGLVLGFKARDYIPPMKMRRMNQLSRFGVAGTRLAMIDAGLEAFPVPAELCGVALGTAFGPVETSVEYMREYVEKGAALAPPQLFAESVANAPGSHVAIEHGLTGFNLTFTQRESSALAALTFAGSRMVRGGASVALAGGVEQMNEMTFSVLDRIGALARGGPDSIEECRPFDRNRNGMVVGEGAAVFILARPGILPSRPYGALSGFGIARDRTATLSDWGTDADAVVRCMRAAIDDAGLGIRDIDAVWASANSSVRGDRLEARAIRTLFGETGMPPVVAVKPFFGEYAGAGGLQLASAVLALRHQTLYPTLGFETPDPELDLVPATTARPAALKHILVNSLSAGGGMVSAVFSAI